MYLGVLWGLVFGNWAARMFKSKDMGLSMIRPRVPSTPYERYPLKTAHRKVKMHGSRLREAVCLSGQVNLLVLETHLH
jgi:hypothetical protein